MKTAKTVTPRRFTRSMSTLIAKRLRHRKAQVSRTPASKSPRKITRKEKCFKDPCNLDTNKDISTEGVLCPRDAKRSTSSNVEVTEVPPTPNNVPVVPTSDQPYHPAPPLESSIFSDWLLNHPSCNRNDLPIPLEVICRLDYRLRDSASIVNNTME